MYIITCSSRCNLNKIYSNGGDHFAPKLQLYLKRSTLLLSCYCILKRNTLHMLLHRIIMRKTGYTKEW